jgi:phage terminase large subunit-like protein
MLALDNSRAANLSKEGKVELIALLEERKRRDSERTYIDVFQSFYDWQYEFTAATKTHYESCLCAANQIGKTYTGTEIDAAHLLGDYPEGWPGHMFDFPPMCWALGYSMEKTRDLLQTALFGQFVGGRFSGGLVPADRIIGWESAPGTANAMRTVRVSHKHGTSSIQFWSYSQGQHAIMGDVVDFVHIDEEPKDQTIRPQVLTRTANGDRGKGGRIIYTFTPENGRTDLVIKFMDDPTPDQFFMMKGWDDAPHMTQEKRERLAALYPDHQRDMRTKGIPMLGHGRIYDLSDDFITCEPFDIPPHWFVLNGMDFGWDHPQAHIKLVEDRDNGDFYVVNAYKAPKVSANDAWGAVKPWAEDVPTAWPHDGLQNEKGRDDAVQQKVHYERAGFKMLHEHATWPEGGNSVESGIYSISDLMRKGKFKIFKGLVHVLEEVRQYHRDEKGRIVKVRDDLLDAIRYAYMMRRYALPMGDMKQKPVKINFKGWN